MSKFMGLRSHNVFVNCHHDVKSFHLIMLFHVLQKLYVIVVSYDFLCIIYFVSDLKPRS